MGVELGKVLANVILPELQNDEIITSHDCSTNALINTYKKLRESWFDQTHFWVSMLLTHYEQKSR